MNPTIVGDAPTKSLVRVPHALHACALDFSQRLLDHPFMRRCGDGSITMSELERFLVQQGKYSAHFTRYLCALISGMSDPGDVLALAQNLSEELGFATDAGEPHSRMYARMLEEFGIRSERERVHPATQNLIDTMYMLCRQTGAVAGLGALCLGAEAIVPAFYSRIIQGFRSRGVNDAALQFFSIHVEEDDDHSATMYAILARKIQESPANEAAAIHAGELAIHARLRFLDSLACKVQ
jgi:pyrroloquinoline-quinone synthase